jgi:hypothetical protein
MRNLTIGGRRVVLVHEMHALSGGLDATFDDSRSRRAPALR